MAIEIERKFLFPTGYLPDKPKGISYIRQGYLFDGDGMVCRVRQVISQFTSPHGLITIKYKGDGNSLATNEFEYMIPFSDSEVLLSRCKYVISKHRYLLPLTGDGIKEFVIDVFKDKLDKLVMGEIEYTEIEFAERGVPPEGCIAEVTEDKSFSNAKLAKITSHELSTVLGKYIK